jgi:hypothetical protein
MKVLKELEALFDLTEIKVVTGAAKAADVEAEGEGDEEENGDDEAMLLVQNHLTAVLDRRFPTSDMSAFITVRSVRKPVQVFDTEDLEFVVPFTVEYTGKVPVEQWAEVEKKLETEVNGIVFEAVKSVYADATKARLLKRTKTDPFKGDPRSLTMLRYRVT